MAPLIDAWLPRRCLLCESRLLAREAGLCATCGSALRGAGVSRCLQCGQSDPRADGRCDDCVRQPPAFDRTQVIADYQAPLDRAIVTMKFRPQRALATALGDLLGQHLANQAWPRCPEQIVAVPLSLERLLERGFNPALVMATRATRRLGWPAPRPLLRRLWHTGSQSGLDAQARRDNVEGVFDCDQAAGRELAGRVVLLVDDVMTTGATLQAAADALKCAGARFVINAVIARTPRNRVVSGIPSNSRT